MKQALIYGPEFPFAGVRPPAAALERWKEPFDIIEPGAPKTALMKP